MAMESDITKKIATLEENKDVTGLEEVKNDAEAGFDGETVGLVEQAIARLNTKVEEITPPVETTEGQKTQVENMGGSETALEEVTAPVDEKIAEKDAEIKNVETEAEQKIGEIKNEVGQDNISNENGNSELEKQQKILLIKEEIGKKYQELQDIDTKKAEHQEEIDKLLNDKGYTKENSTLLESMKFDNEQVKKELFSDKQKAVNYLNKLLEISVNEPDVYRRNVQDLIDNFEDRKSVYESGRDPIGSGTSRLLSKYAEKLNNSEISSWVSKGNFTKQQYDSLQEKIDKDADLSETKQRHESYNELNNPTQKEIEIKNKLGELKKEAKDLGYTDSL
jgi:hypothetical protein